MKAGAIAMLCMGLGVMMTALADEDKAREWHYPPPIYTLRAMESNEPGVHQVKIDNRMLEITLPESAPDKCFMPEAVRTKGQGKEFENKLRLQGNNPKCFGASWHYGLFRGIPLSGDGGIGAAIKVVPHTEIWVKDPNVTTTRGKYTFKGERPVDLDYFKLDDFIRAVHSDTSTFPYWVETINGRRWVRVVRWRRQDQGLRDMPPGYEETLYTPVDRRRILLVTASLAYGADYDVPEEMPSWMREVSGSITTMLRSIKLSPPDDGSPDPFLIDPEQKSGSTPITFPATRPYPALDQTTKQ